MALYTFIMEYEGGTYISQVKSTSPKSAVNKWLQKLSGNSIQGFNKQLLNELAQKMSHDSPIPVEGNVKTWCISATVRGKLALVNFVQTHEE